MRKVLSLPRLTRTLPSGLIPPPWPALASMVYRVVPVLPPDDSSIDYHFELQQNCPVSAAAVMAFRTQFFVTRSRVAVVKGLSSGKPELAGLYSALGEPVRE